MMEITNLLGNVNESSVEGQNFVGYEFSKFPNTHNGAAFREDKLQFVLEIKMYPNANKKIDIFIQDFKVQAETGPLLKLAGFAAMDESVQPPPAHYVHDENDNTAV